MSRQAVTQHLAVLEAANLVSSEWRGREKLHYLNPVPIREIQQRWVRKFETRALDALADLKREVEGETRGSQGEVRLRHVHRRDAGPGVERAHPTRIHK